MQRENDPVREWIGLRPARCFNLLPLFYMGQVSSPMSNSASCPAATRDSGITILHEYVQIINLNDER